MNSAFVTVDPSGCYELVQSSRNPQLLLRQASSQPSRLKASAESAGYCFGHRAAHCEMGYEDRSGRLTAILRLS